MELSFELAFKHLRHTPEQRANLVRVWMCKKHKDCWGGNHLDIFGVIGGLMCGDHCMCWRHAVIVEVCLRTEDLTSPFSDGTVGP